MKLPVLWLFVLDTATARVQRPITDDVPTSTGRAPPYRDALISLHKSLVSIPSISGDELNVTLYLQSYLDSIGLTTEIQPIVPGSSRANVFAYVAPYRQTRVLLTSHIDTVPPYIPYSYHPVDPYSSAINADDVIHGCGVVDAKGSVAAQIVALHSLLQHESTIDPSDVSLLFVVGEERGAEGMRAANSLGLAWEAVIFGEPTELALACGHKGALGFTVRATGQAGHSGYPWTGRNAIDALVEVLFELKKAEEAGKLPSSERFGNTTLNVGIISGGVAGNVIAPTAEARVSVRVAGGNVDEVVRLIRAVVGEVASSASADVTVEFSPGIRPVPIDCDVPGFETAVMNYGTDIPHLQGAHKRYLYGPGSILDAHSEHEKLTVGELETSVEGYKRLILAALGDDLGESEL